MGPQGRPTLSNFRHPLQNDGRMVLISPPILRIPMLWLLQSVIITPLVVLLYCRSHGIRVEAIMAGSVPYGLIGKVLNGFLNAVLIVDYGDPDFAREHSISLKVLHVLETCVLGAGGVDAVTCIDPNIREYVRRYRVKKSLFLPPGGYWKSEEIGISSAAEGERQNVIYAGHVARPPAYRLDILAAAAPGILAKNPKATIVIVGDGEYLPVLRKLARDLNLQHRIRMTGSLSYEEAKAQISQADVALQLLNDMCLGTKVMDYFALGKAVVSCGRFNESYTEFLKNGSNCLLVPPSSERLEEAVNRLLANPGMRRRMGAEALETVRRYDWDSQAEEIMRLISEGRGLRAVSATKL